jgi:hypothetical protein
MRVRPCRPSQACSSVPAARSHQEGRPLPRRLAASGEPGSLVQPQGSGQADVEVRRSPRRCWAPLNGSWPFKRRESHKWEPTQSDALGRSPTQSECSRRSKAPRATWSDDARRQEPPRTSLTRKRSLVQIQYGPRHFSKTCLAARAIMRASDLRFLPLTAGQSVRCCGRHEGFPGRFGALSRRFRRARAQLASPISKVIAGPKGGAVRSWSRGSKEARSLPAVPHRHQLVSARHRPDPRLRTHARPDNERY